MKPSPFCARRQSWLSATLFSLEIQMITEPALGHHSHFPKSRQEAETDRYTTLASTDNRVTRELD